jgi:ribosomal protein S18 acetylase RimI-like enzyme
VNPLYTDQLYRIEKKDFEKLEQLLSECFLNDPLYANLIPKEETRKKLMPELFKCDLEEFFNSCEFYADSEDINGLIIVSDESEHYNTLRYYIDEFIASIKTEGYLIKEDPSLKTLWNFYLGKDYLNSKWTDDIEQTKRMHIIYLAVRPSAQHHGLTSKMMKEVIRYADEFGLELSLETHNERNVAMYEHFGFTLYEIIEKHFDLKQYCMVRFAEKENKTIV